MNLAERIDAFKQLGLILDLLLDNANHTKPEKDTGHIIFPHDRIRKHTGQFHKVLDEAGKHNPWFTRGNIIYALTELARLLSEDNLCTWIEKYPAHSLEPEKSRAVGVVMAGNIPLVGFQDFLTVLISGHKIVVKLSSKDDQLLKFLTEILIGIDNRIAKQILFEEDFLKNIEAVIATGSNNTYRYFEYYFAKYPHIFRKNRNGIAILTGQESTKQLERLADDIFLYFGLGCRNVSKLLVPVGYDFPFFFRSIEKYHSVLDHHKYANNYTYRKSVYLLNQLPHLDNGFLLLLPYQDLSSPIGTIYYEFYQDQDELDHLIERNIDNIQCIVTEKKINYKTISFGQSQKPELWDYADNVDTLKFLINLGKI